MKVTYVLRNLIIYGMQFFLLYIHIYVILMLILRIELCN